jgi:hypothetical protein
MVESKNLLKSERDGSLPRPCCGPFRIHPPPRNKARHEKDRDGTRMTGSELGVWAILRYSTVCICTDTAVGFLEKNHAWLGPKSGTFSAATTGDESGTTPAAVLLLTIAVSLTVDS